MGNNKSKITAFSLIGLFLLTGVYNAFIINSDSDLSTAGVRFIKRLDEIYGVTVAGRKVASTEEPLRLFNPKKAVYSTSLSQTNVSEEEFYSNSEIETEENFTQEDSTQFNGTLVSTNGVIDNISFQLPDGQDISVAASEISGNLFKYELNNEVYSGLIIQVDESSYSITFTDGPMDGTRLRISVVDSAADATTDKNSSENDTDQPQAI